MEPTPLFQEEKLRDILAGKAADSEFTITVCFPPSDAEACARALELARRSPTFREEGEGEGRRVHVTYTRPEADELYRLFQLAKGLAGVRLYLNHRNVPYIQELWLFLMWFQRVR